MKVEQLDKDIDIILKERGEGMFFIRLATSQRKGYRLNGEPGRVFHTISSTQVRSINIENLSDYIDDDRYALIKIS